MSGGLRLELVTFFTGNEFFDEYNTPATFGLDFPRSGSITGEVPLAQAHVIIPRVCMSVITEVAMSGFCKFHSAWISWVVSCLLFHCQQI